MEGPPEGGLVVDEGDLGVLLALGGKLALKLGLALLQLLEQSRRDLQGVASSELIDHLTL